jgi:hypothetical protein
MKMLRRISGAVVLVLAACGDGDAGSADSAATERDSAETTPTSEPSAISPGPSGATSAAPPAAAAARAGRSVCSLTTEAEVTAIMGQPMMFGAAAQPDECLLVPSSGDPNVSVTFQVHRTSAMYDQLSTVGSAERTSGVGDRAVVHTLGASTMVAAVKGGRGYLGRVYNPARRGGAKQQAVEVARKVVGRM